MHGPTTTPLASDALTRVEMGAGTTLGWQRHCRKTGRSSLRPRRSKRRCSGKCSSQVSLTALQSATPTSNTGPRLRSGGCLKGVGFQRFKGLEVGNGRYMTMWTEEDVYIHQHRSAPARLSAQSTRTRVGSRVQYNHRSGPARLCAPSNVAAIPSASTTQVGFCFLSLSDAAFDPIVPSCMRSEPPQWVVYLDLSAKSRVYMKGIAPISPQWLPELAARSANPPGIRQQAGAFLGQVFCGVWS
eukprot:478933-Rhodomonas_salina.1